jgi:hypothetical protein
MWAGAVPATIAQKGQSAGMPGNYPGGRIPACFTDIALACSA